MPSAMKQFMPFLVKEFPHLADRYRKLYARSAYVPENYKAEIANRIRELRARYGLESRNDKPPSSSRSESPQLALAFAEPI
jgi:hypothetical protein